MKEVKKYLLEKTQKKLAGLFDDAANKIGLLFNERFINIPPQVSVPLLENLWYAHHIIYRYYQLTIYIILFLQQRD